MNFADQSLLGFESIILGKLPRFFKLPRIFADLKDCSLYHKPLYQCTQEEIDEAGEARRKLRAAVEAQVRNLYDGN